MIEDSIATLSLQSSLVMPSLLLSVVFDLDVIQDVIDTVDVSLGDPSTWKRGHYLRVEQCDPCQLDRSSHVLLKRVKIGFLQELHATENTMQGASELMAYRRDE